MKDTDQTSLIQKVFLVFFQIWLSNAFAIIKGILKFPNIKYDLFVQHIHQFSRTCQNLDLKKYFLSCKAENPLVYYLSYWELIFRLLGLLGLIKGVTSPHCKLLSRDNFYSWIYFCAFLPCAAIQTIKITTEDQTENDPKVMNPNNNQQFPPPVLYHMPQIMQGKLFNHIWL